MAGIGAVPCALLSYSLFGGDGWMPGGLLGALLTGILLDKTYDGSFRKLES
jgi:hypothetical protein